MGKGGALMQGGKRCRVSALSVALPRYFWVQIIPGAACADPGGGALGLLRHPGYKRRSSGIGGWAVGGRLAKLWRWQRLYTGCREGSSFVGAVEGEAPRSSSEVVKAARSQSPQRGERAARGGGAEARARLPCGEYVLVPGQGLRWWRRRIG